MSFKYLHSNSFRVLKNLNPFKLKKKKTGALINLDNSSNIF